MRVIDADTAISLIQEDKIEGKTLDIIKALGDGLQAETLNQACDRHIEIISNLPTVEAEPTKHGCWKNVNISLVDPDGVSRYGRDGYQCSVCGAETTDITPYCPNCGARMDLTE